MAVVKVIEVLSESAKSWDDATKVAIEKANNTVKNIKSAYVKDQSVSVSNGQITAYRVTLKISFELE